MAAAWLTASAQGVTVTVEGVSPGGDAVSVNGNLKGLTQKAVSVDSAGKAKSLPLASTVSIAFDSAEAAMDAPVTAYLSGGGIIIGQIISASEEWVRIESPSFGEMQIPVGELVGIALPGGAKESARIAARIGGAPAPKKDQLRLAGGDVMEGFIVKVAADAVTFEGMLGKLDYAPSKVAAVIFGGPSRRPARRSGLYVDMATVTGEVVPARIESFTEGELLAAPLSGGKIKVAADKLRRIVVRGGRVVPLAGLKPVSTDLRPLYSDEPPIWPAVSADKSGKLTIRPKSIIVYDLGGKYATFTAEAMVKTAAGSVSLGLAVDGRQVHSEKALTAKSGTRKIKIDLKGAKSMAITCGFGPDMDDAGDRLVLTRARLLTGAGGGDK